MEKKLTGRPKSLHSLRLLAMKPGEVMTFPIKDYRDINNRILYLKNTHFGGQRVHQMKLDKDSGLIKVTRL